ncbi:MAG: hypothetical protein CMC15_15055 [Flavobacteriaceae bacterium]|nr:hypothetical protein [Flavobacteriaceae bacterium]
MMETLAQELLSHSPFIAFLIWQYLQMRSDIKAQHSRYEALRQESKEEEEKLRQRYQNVIKDYTEDRKAMVESLEKRIVSLEKSIRKIFSSLEDLKRMKDTVKELEFEKKIRELS